MRPGLELVDTAEAVVDSNVDIVVVLTPPELHPAQVRLALEHGHHVLCEKPLAASRREAEELFALARARGLHLMSAPFVKTNPTFRELWTVLEDGAIGRVHSARALYGTAGSTWATWFHDAGIGPLPDIGIYNLRSLDGAARAGRRDVCRRRDRACRNASPQVSRSSIPTPTPCTCCCAMPRAPLFDRLEPCHPALPPPGARAVRHKARANLLGDDWDPTGFELWQNDAATWTLYEPVDATWLWTDGLRELVHAIRGARPPARPRAGTSISSTILESARASVAGHRPISVTSTFTLPELRRERGVDLHHLHDHTRSPEEQ